MNKNNEDIKRRVRSIIKELHLTLSDFALKIGTHQSTLSRALSDGNTFGDALINKIIIAFDIDKHWLLTGEGDKFSEVPKEISIEMPSIPALDVKEEGGAVIPSLLSIIKEQGEALKDIALNNDKQRLEEQVHLLNEIQGLKEALESQQKAFKIFCQKLDDLISQSNLPKQKKVS